LMNVHTEHAHCIGGPGEAFPSAERCPSMGLTAACK
jgi:hypothetical protein